MLEKLLPFLLSVPVVDAHVPPPPSASRHAHFALTGNRILYHRNKCLTRAFPIRKIPPPPVFSPLSKLPIFSAQG